MIFLFCNEGFGGPFLRAAQMYSREHPVALTVVHSVPKTPEGAGLRGLLRGARHGFQLDRRKRAFKAATGLTLILRSDVNRGAFAQRIGARDHGIITGFNQIFRRPTIERFATLVNFHPSLLPYYRGPVPSQWCLRNGETHTGFTLHRVTERIDQGEILYQGSVEIGAVADSDLLDRRIAETAVPVFRRYLDHLVLGHPWQVIRLDAATIYRRPIDYAPHAGAEQAPAASTPRPGS